MNKHMNIVFTVCNRFTFANAMALADSVLRYQPGSTFFLCWVDAAPFPVLPAHVNVLSAEKIAIPGWLEICARYYDFELVAACRPWFAKYIFEHQSFTSITFLAPGVLLMDSFASVVTPEMDLFLTPNISKPIADNPVIDDKRILNIGMFNAGAWSLRNTQSTIDLLNWWAARTFDRAKFDLCNGMCMDQLWLNYAPVWIPQTQFISNPAWHYGLRSVIANKLSFENGRYKVQKESLISLDFTGLAVFDPVWSDHTALLSVDKLFKKLYLEYTATLQNFSSMLDVGNSSAYGIASKISVNRQIRKTLAGKLKNVIKFIDEVRL
jgi:hypothetical protein